jgi:hypothetical protein
VGCCFQTGALPSVEICVDDSGKASSKNAGAEKSIEVKYLFERRHIVIRGALCHWLK